MKYSENFGFFLPSRDVGDYADINQISQNFSIIDQVVYKKEEVDRKIGDVGSALDELHEYAQALVMGGATS